MNDDQLEQQMALLAERQVKLGEDVLRIKEQMDHLTAVVVDISERLGHGGRGRDSGEEMDEEVVEELTDGINQVAENVDQVADIILNLATITQEHHKNILELLEHDTQLAERIGGVYERLLKLFKLMTEHFEAQELINEAQLSTETQLLTDES